MCFLGCLCRPRDRQCRHWIENTCNIGVVRIANIDSEGSRLYWYQNRTQSPFLISKAPVFDIFRRFWTNKSAISVDLESYSRDYDELLIRTGCIAKYLDLGLHVGLGFRVVQHQLPARGSCVCLHPFNPVRWLAACSETSHRTQKGGPMSQSTLVC